MSDVVRLITRLNIGGPARQALSLTRRLADDFPTVLAAGTPAAGEGELSDPDVEVVRLPLVRPLRPLEDARAVAATTGLLRRTRPRLVHTHMAKAGAVGRVAAQLVRPGPVLVHTFHGHVLEGYFRPAVQRAFVEVERRLARVTEALVAVSPEVRDDLLELGIGRPEQFRVIRLGFDLAEHLAVTGPSGALRERLGLGPDVPLVGIVGRLVPIKDVDTALAAIARLDGVHLAVMGGGEERDRLEALARSLQIEDRTHFVGWWMDVPAAMADLDVVVLTSRNEGTPVALIEALACARPVVATDVGGVRSVALPDRTGLVVPAADPGAVATAVERLLGDRALGRALATAGREHVAATFTIDRLVAEVQDLYTELLGR